MATEKDSKKNEVLNRVNLALKTGDKKKKITTIAHNYRKRFLEV